MTKTDARIVLTAVIDESESSAAKYGDFVSAHEAYGVLAEEVAELLDAIRSNKRFSIQREAIQVAAVALRFAQEIEGASDAFIARSGWTRHDGA